MAEARSFRYSVTIARTTEAANNAAAMATMTSAHASPRRTTTNIVPPIMPGSNEARRIYQKTRERSQGRFIITVSHC